MTYSLKYSAPRWYVFFIAYGNRVRYQHPTCVATQASRTRYLYYRYDSMTSPVTTRTTTPFTANKYFCGLALTQNGVVGDGCPSIFTSSSNNTIAGSTPAYDTRPKFPYPCPLLAAQSDRLERTTSIAIGAVITTTCFSNNPLNHEGFADFICIAYWQSPGW